MFSKLFNYWHNTTDNPSIIIKINLWFFTNLRAIKFKFSRILFFFVSMQNSIKKKFIKVNFKDWTFEDYFFNNLKYSFWVLIILMV